MNGYIYKCPKQCPIRKNCFILKTEKPLPERIIVYVKCLANKKQDIRIEIGGPRPP